MVDLLEGDKAREQVEVQTKEISELKAISSLQDSLVILRGEEIANLNKLLDLKDVEYRESLRKTEQLNKDLRKQTFKANTFMCTTGLLGVVAIVAALLNAI